MSSGMLVARAGSKKWQFSLGHVGMGAVLAWKAECQMKNGKAYWRPVCEGTVNGELPFHWVVCTNVAEWVCMPIAWRTPLDFLMQAAVAAQDGLAAAAQPQDSRHMLGMWAEEDGSPIPLLRAAATKGFPGMGLTLLGKLANSRAVDVPSGSSLFSMVLLLRQEATQL